MLLRLISALAVVGAALLAAPSLSRAETNLWPLWVKQDADEFGVERWSSLGPLIFGSRQAEGQRLHGLRPVYQDIDNGQGFRATTLAYPLWHQESDAAADRHRWTFFNLVNSWRGAREDDRFSVWPFYFRRKSVETDLSYQALFPLYGDIRERFGQNRLQWALFPLFARFSKDDSVITGTPWPFFKSISGAGHRGVELWPLLGWREQTGTSLRRFMLWPLGYQQYTRLDTDNPSRKVGLLPFYAAESSAAYQSRTYLWPFFGYSRRTSPAAFQSTNLLWPWWVQGRGDHRRVNRWAPFYTYSKTPHREQTWILWPLWRNRQWQDANLHHHRRQLLYFVYHSDVQTSRHFADAAPAIKRHVWPLMSHWNNGAGRVQIQALSLTDVFFPHNERMRKLWSPLFAIYRFNQTSPGEIRHSLLWNAITYRRSMLEESREFHLGPLLGFTATPEGRRWQLLAGLLSIKTSSSRAMESRTVSTVLFKR